MQAKIKLNNTEDKILPCESGMLIKVYGKTQLEAVKDNILQISMVDKVNGQVVPNPIIKVTDKGQIIFLGDAYSFIAKLKGE